MATRFREELLEWQTLPQEAVAIDGGLLQGIALVADGGEYRPQVVSPYPSKDAAGYALIGTRQAGPSGMGFVGASGVNVTAKSAALNPDELLQIAAGTDFTLQFVVDNIGIASGTNPGWFRVGSSSGGTTFLVTNAATRRPWLRVGGTDILKPAAGNQWTDGTTVNLIVVFRSGASAEIWFNGEQQYTTTHSTATPALSGSTDGLYTLLTNSGTENLRGNLTAFRAWRRALPVDRVRQLALMPLSLYEPQRIMVPVASAASGPTGTSTTTNANDTSSASGTTTVTGTLARTNANDTSSASGTTTVLGTLAGTNANDTSSASGTVGGGGGVSGSSATTNANDAGSAAGTTAVTGALARSNANDTASAAGTTTITGALARSNANDTASASGVAGAISGTAAAVNANDTAAASGSAAGGVGAAPADDELPARKRRYVVRNGNELLAFDNQADAQAAQQAIDEWQDQQPAKSVRRTTNGRRAAPKPQAAPASALPAPQQAISVPDLRSLAVGYGMQAVYDQAIALRDLERAAALWEQLRAEEAEAEQMLLQDDYLEPLAKVLPKLMALMRGKKAKA